MGCDITGWVEFSDTTPSRQHAEGAQWWGVINAGLLLGRNYALFGSLFGVRNTTGFDPVAADRGLPSDLSMRTGRDAQWEECHSHTWVTWAELAAVDWDERAPDGEDEDPRIDGDLDRDEPPERISRRQTLDGDWHLLMEMAEPLVRRYGAERVRLVVWFDN